MKDGLYHKDVYWPDQLDDFFVKHNIKRISGFSRHLKEEQKQQGNRFFDLEDITLDFVKAGDIFEIEVKDDEIIKIAVRCKYKNNMDLCMPFSVDGDSIFCRTAWTNDSADQHDTLQRYKYVKGSYLDD